MTTRYKTKAFVFRKNNINESDRVFSVFTDCFGRLDIFAKAIRKSTSKLKSGIDIFFMSEIEFIQGKNRKTLTDASTIEKFDNVCQDQEKFETANRISEVLNDFIKGEEKDNEVFELLTDFFNKLDNGSLKIKNHRLAFQYFFWNFISLQGYRLQVDNCAICTSKLNPYNIYFSNKEGGVVCKKCSVTDKSLKRINSDIVKILRLIFRKDWRTISKLKIEPSSQQLLEEVSENAIHVFCPVHC